MEEWKNAEAHEKRKETSLKIISEPAPSETHAEPPVPLRYFSGHRSVAWQYPAADGVTTSYARRVDAGPHASADAAVSDDEW